MFHNKIYIENLEIEDQIINQITGDLSFKLGGVEELKLSTNLIEPGVTDSVSLGSVSKKFNNSHSNDIVLYNGANTTTISTESAGTTTLLLPVDNGVDGQVLLTDGSGLLSWGDNLQTIVPITITDADLQLLSENQTQITANVPAQDEKFGISVAISGDYAIVGANTTSANGFTSSGTAYIYIRSGINDWVYHLQLTAIDAASGDYFGSSVAISGDYAIVGADLKTVNGFGGAGAVYVYIRNENSWTQQEPPITNTPASGDSFGSSVAIFGNYAIVGAPGKNTDIGAAYIYNWNGTNFVYQQQLINADLVSGDYFGGSVAISGDYAIVGAAGTDVNGLSYAGAAYIYIRDGSNNWTQPTKITVNSPTNNSVFGGSVAIYGDYAIVGARSEEIDNVGNKGAAYIYIRSGINDWTEQKRLTADVPINGDFFGFSVDIYGDYAIVGAYRKTINGVTESGAAYIYIRSGINNWTLQKTLTANTPAQNDKFGNSVAISGDYVIVGASGKTVNGFTNAGAMYINNLISYTASESATYIVNTTKDFNFNLPTTNNLEYHLVNNTIYTANLLGTIFTGNITSAVPGSIVDAYSYNGTWLVK
jgi:hypothetical protein